MAQLAIVVLTVVVTLQNCFLSSEGAAFAKRRKRESYGSSEDSEYPQSAAVAKKCYMCSYSPPRTYYVQYNPGVSSQRQLTYGSKKTVQKSDGREESDSASTSQSDSKRMGSFGQDSPKQTSSNSIGSRLSAYNRENSLQLGGVISAPVAYTVQGGWDKCLGPFDASQALEYGVDVWDCYSNCYIREDPNGNVFRGCYKGEFGVDPSQLGCHTQAGASWCFCEGDRCNDGLSPGSQQANGL